MKKDGSMESASGAEVDWDEDAYADFRGEKRVTERLKEIVTELVGKE